MAPVTLYGPIMSTCSKRVAMALEEKQVPYNLVTVDLMKGEHRKPEFMKMQPFGKVPVLQDGDLVIFESRSIIRYIATKWADQGTDLLGKDPVSRALVDNWLEAESQNFNPAISAIVAEKVFKPWRGQTTDEATVAAKFAELNQVLDVYEDKLSKSQYIAGDQFSLADVSHLPYTHMLMTAAGLPDPINSRPHVKAWWERISSRPTWQKILQM